MTKLYRPSNGSEGMYFTAEFCERCVHDKFTENNPEDGCPQLAASLAFGVKDPEYPREWIYDDEGHGTCTKFLLDGSKEAEDDQIRHHQERLEAAGQGRLF